MACFPDRYPTHLIDVMPLRGGERFVLRPILPQDDWLLAELINEATPALRRLRFPSAIAHVSPDQLQRLTRIDYQRHLALVVARCNSEGEERLVAEARYRIDPDGHGAEFALMVGEQWQRRGIGRRLIRALQSTARTAGVAQLHCDVLADNAAFLALMKRCRFRCTADEIDRRIVRVASRSQQMPRAQAPASTDGSRWLRWLQTLGARPAGASR